MLDKAHRDKLNERKKIFKKNYSTRRLNFWIGKCTSKSYCHWTPSLVYLQLQDLLQDLANQVLSSATTKLKKFLDEWDKAKIESDLAQKKSVRKFNPHGALLFVGIWERVFQSCKEAIIAILDTRSLADEVIARTMCLVEQTFNARP